ncbi:MAG: sugar phosphate nucleotidyltransferase [Acidimicrobiales bacterium]
MKAVIMAGGEGTRLRPLTSTQPKPMLPMADVPMMEHVVRLLARHGFDEIVVTVAYLANAIRTYFGDGSEFGVSISYVSEESPLGTAGSVGNARELLDERFLVISGDVLTDTELSKVWKYHEDQHALATVVLQRVENPLDFGIVTTNPDGSIIRFLEKPSWGEVFTDTVNTGIYIFEPEIFDFIPEGRPSDFSGEIFPALLDQGRPLFGWVSDRYWEDVGTISGYLKAHRDILDGKVDVEVAGFQIREGVYLGEGSTIDPSVTIEEPVLIGANTRIGANAVLRRYTVIGSNSKIGEDTSIENSILGDHNFIGSVSQIRGAVIGRGTDVRHGVVIEDGAVIGDDCYIGEESIVQPLVKIYPSKTVQSRTTVNTSIVWESQATRGVFDTLGITGLPNVDISPELAVRVGMAYGSLFPPGSTLVASRDTSRAARMLKRALMVGINAVGVSVADLELAATPLARYVTKYSHATGGIRVSVSTKDPSMIDIRFHSRRGADLDEATRRKIERLLQREDFRRVLAGEIGDLSFPGRVVENYVESLLDVLDISKIVGHGFKIVTDYSFGSLGGLIHTAFSKFNADVLSLNPYPATARMIAADPAQQRDRVARTVVESGSDLGLIFDSGGEQFSLIDDRGHLLEGQEFVLAMVKLCGATGRFSECVLSANCSNAAARLADDLGLTVHWAKSNEMAVANATIAQNLAEIGPDGRRAVAFGVTPEGTLIAPGVVEGPDAVLNMALVLAALAEHSATLSEIMTGVEVPVVRSSEVYTPYELKGSLMRYLLERNNADEAIFVDGIRTSSPEGGFVLISPHDSEPLTTVTVEAKTPAEADDRLQSMTERLTAIMSALD